MRTTITLLFFAVLVQTAPAQNIGTARVNGAPQINSGRVEGNVQQMTGANVTLNSGAVITGDLLVPGIPTLIKNGTMNFGGTIVGTGSTSPSNYQVILNGSITLGHLRTRTNPVAIPALPAVPSPTGTRTVTITAAGQSAGSFSTLRNLTLNGNVGQYAIPAGTYGDFIANGGSGFTLGVAGATQAAVYNLQHLTLNGQTNIIVLGPVVINVANGFTANGTAGTSTNPAWLKLNVIAGGFTLNGGCNIYGYVNAPGGTVIINGATKLVGGCISAGLTVNANGLLQLFDVQSFENHAPVAANQAVTTLEDTAKAIVLSATDADGQTLTYSVVSQPAHGLLSGTPPQLTYTPTHGYYGPDSFTFKANDGQVDSNIATVSITVTHVNHAPVADAQSKTLNQGSSTAVTLTGSDSDNDPLTFRATSSPAHGALSGTPPNLTYTPVTSFYGTDSFTFVANDGTVDSPPATVSITVIHVNHPPVAAGKSIQTNEDTAAAIVLSATDVDSDPLTYSVLTSPTHGTLTGVAPNLTYTPAAHFHDIDSFTFRANDGSANSNTATVQITVVHVNHPPVANAQTLSVNRGASASVTLTGSDVDNDALTFRVTAPPSHGALSGLPPNLTYTPASGFSGADSFAFVANDAHLDSAPATVSITVINHPPVANGQSIVTNEDTAAAISLSATDADSDPLTYSVLTSPTHGTLTGTAPNLTYTPAAHFHDIDSFTFRANDGSANSNTATVQITVLHVNHPPTADAQTLTLNRGASASVTLAGSDVDNDALTFRVTAPPSHGALSGLPPNLTYTPASGFSGADSFAFVANDGHLDSAPATVSITVINHPPVANPQTLTLNRGASAAVTLTGSDVDNDTLTFRVTTSPTHGALSGLPPNLTYTPASGFSGTDSFAFVANDGPLDSAPATVSITVINHPPVANGQNVPLDEDTTAAITLAGTDPDGDAITYSIVVPPAHGTLAGSAPNVVYTPAADYFGPDSFAFRTNDGIASSADAVVTLTVRPVNDPPVATGQIIQTSEDTAVAILLSATDVDSDPLTYSVLTSPTHGTLSGVAPNLTYTPAAHFYDIDSFTFRANDGSANSNTATVQITVVHVNHPPTADAQTLTLNRGASASVTLTGSDVDNDALTFRVTTSTTHGALSGLPPNLTYTPASSFSGTDSFAFVADDGHLNSAPATVSITVINHPPVATEQSIETNEDTATTILLSATDVDSDPLTYSVLTSPTHGTLSGVAPNLTYTPAAHFHDIDSFTFKANDGLVDSNIATVSITVTHVNHPPAADAQTLTLNRGASASVTLTGSDVDNDALSFRVTTPPTHGALSGLPPNLTYTPASGFSGADSFAFVANDGHLDSAPATISITVINHPPVANGQNVSLDEDTTVAITLTGTDPDGDAITFSIVVQPAHGTLTGSAPNVVYSPAADFNGTDSFAFKVNDGTADSAEAVVNVAVSAVNDAPSAAPQAVVTDQDTQVSITLTGSDVDQDALTFSLLTQPGHGTLSGTAPNLTYEPASNYHGPDSFTFVASDGTAVSAPATVSITVNRLNHRPVAADQTVTTDEDVPKVITLTGTDPDGDPLTYLVASSPAHGRLLGSGATLTYRPNANFNGADSFSYKVNDGVIDSIPAVITIMIAAVNDAPIADAQVIGTRQDQPRSFTLSATDPDNDTLTYSVLELPSHGILSGTPPSLTYTPASAYLGSDRLTFKVNDGTVDSAVAAITINVNSSNTAPSAFPQAVNTDEDQTVNIILTANDPEGNALSYTVTSQPLHGVLSGSAPALVYTPAENYNGSDHFTFMVNDGTLASDPANVSITVRPVNDAPTAEALTVRTRQGESKSFVLAGQDIDQDALTFAVTVQPAHGVLTGVAPNLTYAPAEGYYGADSLKFTVSDGHATSNEAIVTIKVTPPILSRTYTTTADFAEGNLFNVNSRIPDQLQTSIDQSNFDYLWIPVFTKGTVVRLDTDTGRVLGEYRLTPDGVDSPYASRTAIDSKGNCWIANERTNTVIMIANPNGADWIDRNHNGRLDTSLGQDDVKPWLNPDGENTHGGVSGAEDELIVRYVETTATGLRHLSVDAQDNVWVSGVGVQNFDLIDHNTGMIMRTEPSINRGGNGGFVDFDNVLWSTGGSFLRWQANLPLSETPPTPWNLPNISWGVAKDPFGNTWVTTDPSTVVNKYAPDGHLIGAYPHGYTWSQGLAIDANGDVWIATSHCGYAVAHLKNDGTLIGSVPVAEHGPTGVAIDRKGRIWVSSTTGVVQRINPLGGPIGTDGITPVGEVDVTSSYLGGTVWAYSNFTGAALARSGQRGRWTVTYDSEQDAASWGPVVWNADICNDGGLPVYASLSEDGIHYSPEQLLTPGQSVPTGTGRLITIRVDFEPSENGGTSPVLYDLTVGTQGYVPPSAGHGWSVTAGEDISANWPDPIVLRGAVCRSAYDAAVNSTVTWSVVSGPGQVSFSDVHLIQPTCQFSIDGDYVFLVTATAGTETQADEVLVHLTPYNRAPYVSAGHNVGLRSVDESLSLQGVVRDDGLPENAPITLHWSLKYGPGTVVFGDPSQAETTATFSTQGIYTLELSANDTQYTATALVEVRVGSLCTIPPNYSLVSWWMANGSGADHVSGNEAFLEQGATYDNAKVGAGFKFDGVNDRALVFKSPSLDIAKNGSFTIEFWANTLYRGNVPVLLGWNNGNAWGVYIYHHEPNNALYAVLTDTAGGYHELVVGGELSNAGWRHYALTYNKASGIGRIYVNGVVAVQSNLGSFDPQTSYDLSFGHVPGMSTPYAGMLDEISLYNRALDGQEIWNVFAADANGKCPMNGNAPPVVSAGPDQSVAQVGDVATLYGSVTDDGLPLGANVRQQWSKAAGPGNVTFANPGAAQTTVTFDAPGIYVLTLTADDTFDAASDSVEVRVATFCSIDTPSGLEAWWPGQGNAREVVHASNGRLLNGTGFAPGKTSLGFGFDGVNDSVRVPAKPHTNIASTGDGSLTMEFWANTSYRGNVPVLVGYHNGSVWGVHLYHHEPNNALYAVLMDTAGGYHEVVVGGEASNLGWRHYALTYDKPSGLAKVYVNGVVAAQSNLGSFVPQTSYDLYFGMVQGRSDAYAGTLDEISLYHRALDGQEIYDIFAANEQGKCPVDSNQPPAVSAGPDQSIAQNSGTVGIHGSVTDDGLPVGSSITVQWSKVDGPGNVTFANAGAVDTTASFDVPGIYVLRLTANDTLDQASDTMEVRVGTFCLVESPAGLAGWWPGQGNGRDVVGGNDGRLLNGVGFVAGKVSLGFKFDGANDSVRVPASATLDVARTGDGSLTMEFWANTTYVGNVPMLVGYHNGTAAGVHLYHHEPNNALYAVLMDTAGGYHELVVGGEASNAGWRHYGLTYDKPSGIGKLYINGILRAQSNLGSFTPQTSYDLYFGGIQGKSDLYAGILDEISLYSRALDGQEIFDLYASGQQGKCPVDANHSPVVTAGPDQSVAQTGRDIILYGEATDDGLPAGSSVSVQWAKVDGPGNVAFGNPSVAQTTARFDATGVYVLRLTANDTLNQVSDTMVVRVAAFCSVEPPPGLAAWWPANGDASDVVGGNVGRLLNGVTFAPGKVSMGFQFDGADDSIRVPAVPSLDIARTGDGSLTMEFWANTTYVGNVPMLVGYHNGTAAGVHLYHHEPNNALYAVLMDTAGVYHEVVVGGEGSNIGWRHYGLTYDKTSGIGKLYINGILRAQSNLGSFTPQTSYDLYFGGVQGKTDLYAGKLDEVTLYSRALDGNEIHDIFAADSDGKCPVDDNASPTVNAGPDQSVVQVSDPVTLHGSVTDDGLPLGSSVNISWAKLSGPGNVTFTNPNQAETAASFSLPGIYVLQLMADDGLDEAADTVEVRIGAFCRVDSPPGLSAWWPGNGDAKDVISGQVGRTLNGADFVDAKVSMGFRFDGSNDSVRIPAAAHLNVGQTGDGSLTMEFWANTTYVGNVPMLVGYHSGTALGVHLYHHEPNNALYAVLMDTAGGYHEVVVGGEAANVGWRHYGLTYDKPNGIGKLYINGILRAQSNLGSFTPQTSYDLYFGGVQGKTDLYAGKLDEISLYNRALDGQEIWDIFSADANGKCPVDQNQPPAVNAGADQAIPENGTATLHGTVSDDGLPAAGHLSFEWIKLDGPGTVIFANASSLETSATFSAPGIYVLKLTADDTLDRASDTLEVRVGAPCSVESSSGLAAWWPGNGDAKDVVSGQVGRLLNGVAFAPGKVSLGFGFDGANDSVRVPAAANLDIGQTGDGSLTMEFWANTTYVGNVPMLVGYHNGTALGVHLYHHEPNNALYAVLMDTAGGYHEVVVGGEASNAGWRHYGLTYDKTSGIGRLYINGVLRAESNLGSFTPQTSYDLYFGGVQGKTDLYAGTLDEISLYNRALSATEIEGVFTAGACGKTPFVRNAPPTVNAGYDRAISLPANSVTLSGTAVDDGIPANGTLTVEWTQTGGPAVATLSSPTTLQTTATFTQTGDYTFLLTANDGALSASSSVHVTVLPDLRTPPTVSLTAPAEGSRFQSSQTITISANAADNDGHIVKVEFFSDGVKLGEKLTVPYSFAWNNAPGGMHALTASATDNDGLSATSSAVNIEVVDPGTAPPPRVELVSPDDGSVITAPTGIVGSVEMATLRSWRVEYQLQGTPCTQWIVFGSGTGQVHESVLATLDPTLLLNGTYIVRLVVTDLANVSFTPNYLTFFIDGNMKVGNFTATFKDLELPLSGVPITVTRTYDSRNHCPGDFGYGWTLDVDSIRLESTELMGDAWSQFIFVGNLFDPSYYRLDDVGPHLLSVKMPDGQLLRFTPKLIMDRPYNRLASLLDQDGDDIGQVFAPIRDDQPLLMIYRPRPGTEGAVLKARAYRTTNTVGGSGTVSGISQFYLADTSEGAISLATRPGEFGEAPAMVDATGWELTLRDGRVLLFDAAGKLEELRDRVGNKVTFNRDGAGKIGRITHSPSGKEIVFARDSANRIKSITDPAGNAVQYRYTSNGDLDAVFERGNNPALNQPTTSFSYKGVTHLLEDILDARGIRAAKNFYDDAGRLIKTIDADGNETLFTHDLNTRTETIRDRAGNITVHRYDERGNIIETRAPDGTVTTTGYHHWSDGTLSELKETETVTGSFTNESNPTGPLVIKTLTTLYSYEDEDPGTPPANDGLLRKLVDPKGNITTFTYDGRGNVLTLTDANGNAAGGTPAASMVNTYYDNGLLQTATDALGHTTSYTYDAKGNPDTETRTVTLINADGSSSQVNSVTDRDYNLLGQLERLTDPAGHATTYEYDANSNRRFERTTRTDGGATVPVVTETAYDEQDRPVLTWNADNPRAQAARPSSQTFYDGNGKVEWTYDALGRGTHQEYDSRGLAFKTTHPDNTFETVTYDSAGRREISTDRRGKATRTVYDAMGRVSATIFLGGTGDPSITLSATAYDAAGRVWQSTDANNNTTSYGYDDAGRRTSVVSPRVAVSGGGSVTPTTRYSYDANGNLRFVTDPKGRITEHVYDALNRRFRTIMPAAPIDVNGNEQIVVTTVQTGYDEMGRRVSETDASNRTKRYGYDVLGRLRHVIDYAGQATRFNYDELGNQLSQTDTNNHTTSYTYDNAGRRLTRTLPLGQQEVLGYDDAGNLASRRDFNGRVTTFGYDAMNRLRYRVPDASLGEPTIEFTYNANGQRETMRDATGTTAYGYDGRGQLLAKQTPFGTLSYGYYPNGSLQQMSSGNANGVHISYAYDALNRLATVTDASLGNTTYGYDEVGNLANVAYPNNIQHQYTYNALNRLDLLIDRSPTNTIINSWKYHTTGAGQRTSVEEFDHRTASYTYDNLGRLKTETVTGSVQDGKNGTVTYGYDNVGNRLTRTSSLSGVTNQAFGYDPNDRVNGDQYDSNGNTKLAPVSQPAPLNPQQVLGTDDYDSENRLIQRFGTLNSQPATINFVYDGDGNRVREVVNGQVKTYLIDDRNPTGYAQVVEEIVNGTVNHTYTYGHDLISQDQFDPATNNWHASFYAYDGHGNVRFLTDETGAVTDTYTYDAFGTLITVTGSTNNRYLYSGEQFDPSLGLYYLRARLMNPLTGRFWTQDSYEGENTDPISLHKYLYANTDPTNRADPSGQFTLAETLAVANTIVTVATFAHGAYQVYQGHYIEGTLEMGLSGFWGISGTKKVAAFGRWWLFNRGIRAAYLNGVREIGETVQVMRKVGKPAKEIAESVVESRNAAKVAARKLMNPDDAAALAARNLEKYGNEVGPTVEQMIKEGKTYEQIIDSAQRTSSWYDWLFLLF